MVSKGQVVGMTGTASRGYTAMYLAHMNSLTASRCHIKSIVFKIQISNRTSVLTHVLCVVSTSRIFW